MISFQESRFVSLHAQHLPSVSRDFVACPVGHEAFLKLGCRFGSYHWTSSTLERHPDCLTCNSSHHLFCNPPKHWPSKLLASNNHWLGKKYHKSWRDWQRHTAGITFYHSDCTSGRSSKSSQSEHAGPCTLLSLKKPFFSSGLISPGDDPMQTMYCTYVCCEIGEIIPCTSFDACRITLVPRVHSLVVMVLYHVRIASK